LERVGGIQMQYAPSGYVGLWSRVAGFDRDALTRALERRSVVQATLMRITIHLTSARDFAPLAAGVREARRESWLRSHRGRFQARGLAEDAARLRELLADGPRPRDELMRDLGLDPAGWNGVGLWVDLVRVPPSGTWERRRADLFALADEWLGPSGESSPEDGRELLVRRYLAGFGPARPREIADWGGISVTAAAAALARIPLRRFCAEDGDELVDLPRAPLPDPETPAPVRFLPTWDATLLAHARRTGILPEEHRPRVFSTRTPQSVATFLVDGAVAGTWRPERGRIAVEPFGRLSRVARREVEEEAERLAVFHG
ncbi:MAG TPA: winged helix DNA-binding domain-containing protein, partial [Gaiellaceae bacterium]|nr:winged helix DNA-binding domain-containing protein [Gaiellaceae bacterium]